MARPFQILVMPGEGIGPEITAEGVRVLQAVADRFALDVAIRCFDVGLDAYHRTGSHLPDDARRACDEGREHGRAAILFGAVSDEPIGILRKDYDLFANLRPIRLLSPLVGASPLGRGRARGIDMLIVRELVGDVYYGDASEGVGPHGRWASQAMYYDETQVRRIVHVALAEAARRRHRLTLVHKGNVVRGVFAIWSSVLEEARRAFPGIACDEMLVDNMAMQMVLRPADFDVLLCPNLFGDILSDLGAGLVGSIGLVPSASVAEGGFALYEPIGGTAPDLAGMNRANPIASILSVAMMCRSSLGRDDAARAIEDAVVRVLRRHRTADVLEPGTTLVSTSEMGQLVARGIAEPGGAS